MRLIVDSIAVEIKMSSTNTGKPKISCETKDVVKKETFKWSINNFKMRLNRRINQNLSAEFISDTKIDCNPRFELKWMLYLSIEPINKYDKYGGFIEIMDAQCLFRISEQLFPKDLSVVTFSEVSVLNNRTKNKVDNYKVPYQFELVTRKELLNKANNLLPNDTLTISFEVSTVIKSSTIYKEIQQFNIPESPLYNELPSLLLKDKESCSDVIIEVDKTDLKAHKFILAAQSPVFSVMLKHKSMKEAQNNRIIIKDMDLEVGRQMLEFIYTNKQPSRITEFANELMAAAHKYEMNRLRVMCEEILFNNITFDNAIKTLIYANMYGAENLKEAIINFMKNNSSVLDSTEFMQLEKEIPSLCFEVFRKIRQE